MKLRHRPLFSKLGGVSFLAGLVITASFVPLTCLTSLRGQAVPIFLAYFLIAAAAYGAAVYRLDRDHLPLALVWVLAVVFRILLLLTTPTLSDDVFRYIWDGHLFNQGVNPYALPVTDPNLDRYDIPLRALVNNNWMATPYMPAAQFYFALLSRISPQNPWIFQLGAALLDLGTGWLVMDILYRLGIPRRRVLIYLWNPLLIVEFAHGAHLDSLMIFLIMGAFWFLVRADPRKPRSSAKLYLSATALAGATLTKIIPILLVPLLIRRWKPPRLALFFTILIAFFIIFSLNAGWGLSGELDGKGLFGAVRIYSRYWNYNSGIYHWLEELFSGYMTPGPVPVDIVGQTPINAARFTSGILLAVSVLFSGVWAWSLDNPQKYTFEFRNLYLLRVALLLLGAFLMLINTVHPWYITLFIPFLPFLLPAPGEKDPSISRFIWPWIYFSCAVALSYTTYYDMENLREYDIIRQLEYLPFFLLLLWVVLPFTRRWLSGLLAGEFSRHA